MKLFLTSKRLDGLIDLINGNPEDLLVGFVPTAASVAHADCLWVHDDEVILKEMGFKLRIIHLEEKTSKDLEKDFEGVDIIFVAGGNTFYLLQEARKSGFCDLVWRLVKQGVIYAGASAGAVLAGPTVEPVKYLDSIKEAPELEDYTGLGLVEYVVIPHNIYPYKESPYDEIFAEYAGKLPIMPLSDEGMILIDRSEKVIDI